MRYAVFGILAVMLITIGGTYFIYRTVDSDDMPWRFVVAAPLILLIVKEFGTSMLQAPFHRLRCRCIEVGIEPLAGEEMDEDSPGQWDDSDEGASRVLRGLWTGTARIRPVNPNDPMRLLPLRLAFGPDPLQPHVIPIQDSGDQGVIQANLVEYDDVQGHLDLRLVVNDAGRRQTFDAKMKLCSGRFLPEDETDEIALELEPARFVAARRRFERPPRK